jgi:acyl-homoserine-lactone acylase
MRTSTVLSVLVALLFMSCNERGSFNRTEIVWDNWGVPHIYAQNEAEMYYAFGWAQMQSSMLHPTTGMHQVQLWQ